MKLTDRNLLLMEAARLLRADEPLSDAMRGWLADGLECEADGRPWPGISGRGTKVPAIVLASDFVAELDRRNVKDPEGADRSGWVAALKMVAGKHCVSERTVTEAQMSFINQYSELGELGLELIALQKDALLKKE